MDHDDDGLALLKQELQNEEIHLKVNAIHRMTIVIRSIGEERVITELIPYLDEIIKSDTDDEVLFAIAEEIGKVYSLVHDKTVFLDLLFELAKQTETVVREQATASLNTIVERLSDAEIQNKYAQSVIQLAQQGDYFPARQSSCHLFEQCYQRAGPHKEKLRKKFIELCNEDQPLIRRACASKLGRFATRLDKQYILQEILPIFRQLSQDEQDVIRVLCLESLIPMAHTLTKEENQIHTLGTLLAAGEDKSWKVRLAFAKNFSEFANAFGKEITDNNLIQTFTLLLSDNEFEVKLAAINNLSQCLKSLSTEKISNLILPTITNVYSDGTVPFKAGVATALSEMAEFVGKDYTVQKILPILSELIRDDNSEILINVVEGLQKISLVVGIENMQSSLDVLTNKTQEGQWRVRLAIFNLLGELGLKFGRATFQGKIQAIFFGYLHNSAASVRDEGIKISIKLAEKFGNDWIMDQYVPMVLQAYELDKRGYNYRICCLKSLGGMIQYMRKEQIQQKIIPLFSKALKDSIPNVRFMVPRILLTKELNIPDVNFFQQELKSQLIELVNDTDPDVSQHATKLLNA